MGCYPLTCTALVKHGEKHGETLKNLAWYFVSTLYRLAEYRLMPGEELSTALPTRAEHRPGAEARNQVSSDTVGRDFCQLQLDVITSQEEASI